MATSTGLEHTIESPNQGKNFFIDHNNGDKKSYHTGYYPPENFLQIEEDYKRYAEPRGISRRLWYGTAQQESTAGKSTPDNLYHSIPDLKFYHKLTEEFVKNNNYNATGILNDSINLKGLPEDFNKYDFDPQKEFAARKLSEGLEKNGGDERKAALYYNPNNGKTIQYDVPRLGENILNNPRVKELLKLEPKQGASGLQTALQL